MFIWIIYIKTGHMKKSYIRIEGRIILKIKVLEYFITLAESQSTNEAAGKLYIAQPSLTKALQLFEAEIGTQLFQRKKTGIQLTEAGKRILPEAKQMVEYYNGWLSLSEKLPLRAVDIYIQASFPNFLLPKVVLQFKKLHPSLQINCEVSRTPEQYISQDTERPVLSLCMRTERIDGEMRKGPRNASHRSVSGRILLSCK